MSITPLPLHPCTEPDRYRDAPNPIDATDVNDRRVRMWRTGITPPGYPNYAIYKQDHGHVYYVYQGGYFWPAQAWQEHWRDRHALPVVEGH